MSYFGNARRQNARSSALNLSRKQNRASAKADSADWTIFRLRLVAAFFCIIWWALWVRAAYIQIWDGSRLAELARRQYISAERVDTPRGMILDRNGQILARSIEVRSVYANPAQIDDAGETAARLAGLLNQPTREIRALLRKGKNFTWVARQLDDATSEQVARAKIPGIELVREYERFYPYKQVAGQLLGFVGMDGKGLEGLERSFDEELSGLPMRQVVQRDASGRRFYLDRTPLLPAADLQLTIDLQIQCMAEEVLAKGVIEAGAKWGGMLIADVQSGEVLAWAQYPFFNPNAYKNYKAAEYRNRLALDALEPGSTFKPFVVASAIQEGTVNRNTVFYCEHGSWKTRKTTIRDDGRAWDSLTVNQILMHSSNIGCGKIGLTLGINRFHKYLSMLGFGQRTGLQINESKGILRAPHDWSELDLISTSFGQSISVTQAQMAQAYLTLANDGIYKPLHIIMHDQDSTDDGGGQRVFSAATSHEVLSMMQDVVKSGTGKKAAVEGLSIAGKTGTAQKSGTSGYGRERTASFVGLTPAEHPRYLIVIFIDEPHKNKYGGTIAAPLFHDVIPRVLAYHGTLPDPGAVALRTVKKIRSAKKPLPKEETVMGEVRKSMVTVIPSVKPKNNGAVPDVVGQSVRRAVEMFARQGLVPVIKGEGARVVRQIPTPGVKWIGQEQLPHDCVLWVSES